MNGMFPENELIEIPEFKTEVEDLGVLVDKRKYVAHKSETGVMLFACVVALAMGFFALAWGLKPW